MSGEIVTASRASSIAFIKADYIARKQVTAVNRGGNLVM
jgi:hypothetical protein